MNAPVQHKERQDFSWRFWSEEEMAVISANLHLKAPAVAKLLEGRSSESVYKKMCEIRSGKTARQPGWTPSEDDVIVENSTMTSTRLTGLLPGRSSSAIDRRRRALLGAVLGKGALHRLNPNTIGKRQLLAKTCPKCGHLLASKWFYLNRKTSQWATYCKKCAQSSTISLRAEDSAKGDLRRKVNVSRSAVYVEMAQRITLPQATRKGQEYTEADHKILSDPSITALEKALALKRSYTGVTSALQINGYKSNRGIGDPLQEIWVISNPNILNLEEIQAANPLPRERQWDWDDAA